MAIVGITHNEYGLIESNAVRYRGKISTGYAPNEGPNKASYPQAAGFFRILSEKMIEKRIGAKTIQKKVWALNTIVQKKIEELSKSKKPTNMEIISMYKRPEEMWESFLASYNDDGLACKGNGVGTEASYVDFDADGNRVWKTRPCTFKECEVYKARKCSPRGILKCYPTADFTPPNPYRLETNSINTIINIETGLEAIYNTLRIANIMKSSASGTKIAFDGLFGIKLFLVHKKKKSGGRDIFVTEVMLSKESRKNTTDVIGKVMIENAGSETVDTGAMLSMSEDVVPGESLAIEMVEAEILPDGVDEDGVIVDSEDVDDSVKKEAEAIAKAVLSTDDDEDED